MVHATPRPLYHLVKRHDTHCSKVVGLGIGLDGYRKSRLNWDSKPKKFIIHSTQLAISNRITKPIPCYQKPEVCYYDTVLPVHKTLELVLPNLSLCQMHDYILN